jgi:hypothetical protein
MLVVYFRSRHSIGTLNDKVLFRSGHGIGIGSCQDMMQLQVRAWCYCNSGKGMVKFKLGFGSYSLGSFNGQMVVIGSSQTWFRLRSGLSTSSRYDIMEQVQVCWWYRLQSGHDLGSGLEIMKA